MYANTLAMDNSYKVFIPTNFKDIVDLEIIVNLDNVIISIDSQITSASIDLSTDKLIFNHLILSCIDSYIKKNTKYVRQQHLCLRLLENYR